MWRITFTSIYQSSLVTVSVDIGIVDPLTWSKIIPVIVAVRSVWSKSILCTYEIGGTTLLSLCRVWIVGIGI